MDMATKNPIFTSVIFGSPTITSEKLIGSENYPSWSASVELWFMGQGYEDHLVYSFVLLLCTLWELCARFLIYIMFLVIKKKNSYYSGGCYT